MLYVRAPAQWAVPADQSRSIRHSPTAAAEMLVKPSNSGAATQGPSTTTDAQADGAEVHAAHDVSDAATR
jgi:hypothetical protein